MWLRTLAVALAGLVIAVAWYQHRRRQVAEQLYIRLEERVAERTRIARDLHDSLLQGFQGLLFQLHAARTLLPARPAEARQLLETVLDRADAAIAESRAAVQDLRSAGPEGGDLLATLEALGEELGTAARAADAGGEPAPACRVLVMGKVRPLDPLVRDEVYRIAREALRNAFRHASASAIEAELSYGTRTFSLRIRDDGVGINPGVLANGGRPGHWGLPGMRERAQRFGGRLNIWSDNGAGTEAALAIPAAVAYAKSTYSIRSAAHSS